jgi:isochorismate pyruvate lyase
MIRQIHRCCLAVVLGGILLGTGSIAAQADARPDGGKPPAVSCASLDEVRSNIDRIDKTIVPLLAERAAYVAEAAKFKSSQSTVVDVSRVERIIARVRAMAEENGADPDLIERLYRGMIETYTAFEKGVWTPPRPAP